MCGIPVTWWRHQMATFSALLVLCAGNSPVSGEFPSQRPVTRSFDVFFDLRSNKRLTKQSWGWWFETPSPSLYAWCYCTQNMTCRSSHTRSQQRMVHNRDQSGYGLIPRSSNPLSNADNFLSHKPIFPLPSLVTAISPLILSHTAPLFQKLMKKKFVNLATFCLNDCIECFDNFR